MDEDFPGGPPTGGAPQDNVASAADEYRQRGIQLEPKQDGFIGEMARRTVRGVTKAVDATVRAGVSATTWFYRKTGVGEHFIPGFNEAVDKASSKEIEDAVVGEGLTGYAEKNIEGVRPRSDYWAYDIYEGLVQFSAGMLALRGGSATTFFGKLALNTGKGMAVDAVAFDPYDQNFAELLDVLGQKHNLPALSEIGASLSVDESDEAFAARVKRAVPGAVLGPSFEGLLSGMHGVWRLATRVKAGTATPNELARAVEELGNKIVEPPTSGPVKVVVTDEGAKLRVDEGWQAGDPIPPTIHDVSDIAGATSNPDGSVTLKGWRGVSGKTHPLEPGHEGSTFSSAEESVAREYASKNGRTTEGTVVQTETTLKNPLIIDSYLDDPIYKTHSQEDIIRWAKENGHDGVIFKKGHGGADEWAVFDQMDVKINQADGPAFESVGEAVDAAETVNARAVDEAKAAEFPTSLTPEENQAITEYADLLARAYGEGNKEAQALLESGSRLNLAHYGGPGRIKAVIESINQALNMKAPQGVLTNKASKALGREIAAQVMKSDNPAATLRGLLSQRVDGLSPGSKMVLLSMGDRVTEALERWKANPIPELEAELRFRVAEMYDAQEAVEQFDTFGGRELQAKQIDVNSGPKGEKGVIGKLGEKLKGTTETTDKETLARAEKIKKQAKVKDKVKKRINKTANKVERLASKIKKTRDTHGANTQDFIDALSARELKKDLNAIKAMMEEAEITSPVRAGEEQPGHAEMLWWATLDRTQKVLDEANVINHLPEKDVIKGGVTEAEISSGMDAAEALKRQQPKANPLEELAKDLYNLNKQTDKEFERAAKLQDPRVDDSGGLIRVDKSTTTPVDRHIMRSEEMRKTVLGMPIRDVEVMARATAMAKGDLKNLFKVTKIASEARVKTGAMAKINTLFMWNLLSKPITSAGAFASGAATTGWMGAERIGAGLIHAARTGDMALTKEGLSYFKYLANKENWGEAFKGAKMAFKSGHSIMDPKPPVKVFENATLDRAAALPTAALSANDEVWRMLNYRSKVRARTIRQNPSLSGAALEEEIRKNLEASIDQKTGAALLPEFLEEAGVPTFSNPLPSGSLGGHLNNLLNSLENSGSRFILPFIKATANTMSFAFERTPVIGLIARRNKELLAKGGEDASLVMAKQVMAMGAMVTTWGFFKEGMITGRGPADKNLNAAWRATHEPYSIKTPWGWVSYRRTEPFASLFGAMADFSQVQEIEGVPEHDKVAVTAAFVAALSNVVGSKTYGEPLFELLSGLTDREYWKVAGWFDRTAGALMVPPLITAANPDPVLREMETTVDHLYRRIPGMSEGLPPKTNFMGEPIIPGFGDAWGGFLNAGQRLLNPFGVAPVKQDVVMEELDRLGKGLPTPPKKTDGGIWLTDPALAKNGKSPYQRYMELIKESNLREALEEEIKSASYKELPEDGAEYGIPGGSKGLRLAEIQQRHYRNAYKDLLSEYPDLDESKQGIKDIRRTAKRGGSPTEVEGDIAPALRQMLRR